MSGSSAFDTSFNVVGVHVRGASDGNEATAVTALTLSFINQAIGQQ
jgi:hypothetical protein